MSRWSKSRGCLDGSRTQKDRLAALPAIDTVRSVDRGDDSAARVALETVHDGFRPDLGAATDRVRQVGDVHARLGADPATLVTISAIDAGGSHGRARLREIARHDGDGSIGRAHADLVARGLHEFGRRIARDGWQRVTPCRIPRIRRRSRNADERFDAFVIRAEIVVRDRPVDAGTLFRL